MYDQIIPHNPFAFPDSLPDAQLRSLDVESECSVCTCASVDAVATECNHVFCRECITRWLRIQPACPMCRALLG